MVSGLRALLFLTVGAAVSLPGQQKEKSSIAANPGLLWRLPQLSVKGFLQAPNANDDQMQGISFYALRLSLNHSLNKGSSSL